MLGCFYAPPKPWSKNTMLLFKEPLSRYARRFFHHLLRYSRSGAKRKLVVVAVVIVVGFTADISCGRRPVET